MRGRFQAVCELNKAGLGAKSDVSGMPVKEKADIG